MSEIFKNYVKIMKDAAEHTETSFKETNPRMDSLSIEQISKLYNNVNEAPKEMQYKKNIMEIAHPKPLVISPAHDNINGLIENENEGQNIRMHIVMKENNGQSIQAKYAEKKLLLSLVRLGNHLDNIDNEELRTLADTCLAQATSKPITKIAFPFMITAVATLAGLLYAQQHLKMHSDGFKKDYQKIINEINDITSSNSNWGVGYSYTPEFKSTVAKLSQELAKLNDGVNKVVPVLENIETPHTASEYKQIAQLPETKDAEQALNEFKILLEEVNPFIDDTISNFNNEGFKQRAIAGKGMLSSLVDSASILHGGAGLISDDFDDVKRALETIQEDISEIVKGIRGAESVQQHAAERLQASQTKIQNLFHSTKPAAGKSKSTLDEMADRFKRLKLPGM